MTDEEKETIARINRTERAYYARGRQYLGDVVAGRDGLRVYVLRQVHRTRGFFADDAPRVERLVYAVLDDESHQSTHETIAEAIAAACYRAGEDVPLLTHPIITYRVSCSDSQGREVFVDYCGGSTASDAIANQLQREPGRICLTREEQIEEGGYLLSDWSATAL